MNEMSKPVAAVSPATLARLIAVVGDKNAITDKDEQAPYPQLRRCRVAATELDDPEQQQSEDRQDESELRHGLALLVSEGDSS